MKEMVEQGEGGLPGSHTLHLGEFTSEPPPHGARARARGALSLFGVRARRRPFRPTRRPALAHYGSPEPRPGHRGGWAAGRRWRRRRAGGVLGTRMPALRLHRRGAGRARRPVPPPRAGPSAPHPAPPPPTVGGWSMQLQAIKGQGGGSDGAEASHRGRRKGRMRGGHASSRAAARARASRGPPLNLGGTQAAPPSRPRRRARHPPLGQRMGAAKRLHASAGPGNAHQAPSLQNTQPPSPANSFHPPLP
jgi:hypothetical protein